jgi:hypothetical protein
MPEATGKGVRLAPGRAVPPADEDDEVLPGTNDEVVPGANDEVVPGANGVGAGSPVDPDGNGWHWADDPGPGAAPPGPPLEPEALVGLGWAVAVAPPSASGPVPSAVVWAPAPLVPAPGRAGAAPRSSTAPACMIARRTGCTPSETLAMTAMAARPVASRSAPMRHLPSAPKGSGNVSPLLLGFSVGMPL